MTSWVVPFAEGDSSQRERLGGKGAGLVGMSRAGLPVPQGFVIVTDACRAYLSNDHLFPDGLWEETLAAVQDLEASSQRGFGGSPPLLVSVRSGAAVSMPGMMDTVLNLGLNPSTVGGLAELTGEETFAWDSYRRFVQMFSEIVLGVPKEPLEAVVRAAEDKAGTHVSAFDVAGFQDLVDRLKDVALGHARQEIPDEPLDQLRLAIAAVFDSWMNRRAVDYRRLNSIADTIGTAVTVQAMVFGNTGDRSGTGVAFTRNPATGEPGLFGEFLINAQGEDVVAGLRTPNPISQLQELIPEAYEQLVQIAGRLEAHYTDMQDIEFTIEDGQLYMLQTRSGKRTGRAAVRIAGDLVSEEVIDPVTAVQRVSPDQLEQLLHPVVDPDADRVVITTGLNAAPGAACGRVVFSADEAERRVDEGHTVVLMRHETSPDDFHGMAAAVAIVTARGGVTSHAAVVARGLGTCCVVGCTDLEIEHTQRRATAGDTGIREGELVTVDGATGEVLLGEVPTIAPQLDHHYEQLMSWADEYRTMGVRANADTPEDSESARRLGAEGIGLCRTEHMFFGADRIAAMREMIMAPNHAARADALATLEPFQVTDFEGIFTAMSGLPVTIRLLDPPLHEFLPSIEETTVQLTDLKLRLRSAANLEEVDRLLHEVHELEGLALQIRRLSEQNPMLGHRGCRLGNLYPEITRMQVRAIFLAALRARRKGVEVQPEIMVPLVGYAAELEHQREIIDEAAVEVFREFGDRVSYTVGTMIELPRAAIRAAEIAEHADFFSFGTNDLTQTTLGMSRDDAARFLPGYVRRGILQGDPFQTIDTDGVGWLVDVGVTEGRSANPELKLGVCGEHGGDPASIAFFQQVGLDYVSCSAFRVPVARLAAAQAALSNTET